MTIGGVSASSGSMGQLDDKKTFSAAVVNATLSNINSQKGPCPGSSGSLYDVNQKVLGAYYYGDKGSTLSDTV